MATWYVRKSGSNSNAGTSPSAAWLTFGHALASGSGVSAGDSIYIGAGVYRETVTIGLSGSSVGGNINIIGDVDGAKTGDAGEIELTAFTTNDTTASASSTLLAFGSKSYLAFSLLTMVGGAGNPTMVSASSSTNVSFTDCTFLDAATPASTAWTLTTVAAAATSWTIDRCSFFTVRQFTTMSIVLPTTNSGSADYDAMIVFRNSFFISVGGQTSGGVLNMSTSGANTFKGGGVRVYNCNILSGGIGFWANSASLSTTVPCEIHNSVIACTAGTNATTSGQITETYNLYYSTTPRTNVTAGTGSISNGSYAPMIEVGQSYKYGAGAIRPFMAPTANSPVLGFGSGGTGGNYPSVDWMNRPRPSGGGSASYAAGYLERHDFAIQDTTIYNDVPSSGELVGPGDQFIQVPVNGGSSTISMYLRYDSYGGSTLPSATLLASGELGIATQTISCTSAASGAFQQLTFTTISASKAGWVTLQVTSYDTNGTGTVHFDTLAVT